MCFRHGFRSSRGSQSGRCQESQGSAARISPHLCRYQWEGLTGEKCSVFPFLSLTENGHTPLMWACQTGELSIAKILIESKADITLQENVLSPPDTPSHPLSIEWMHSPDVGMFLWSP